MQEQTDQREGNHALCGNAGEVPESKYALTRRQFVQQAGLAAAALAVSAWEVKAETMAEKQNQITLALVGGAHIHTPGFINMLKKREDARVKSVWDHDAVRAKNRAEQLGAQVVQNVDDIWNDPQIQGVIICSETNRHHELVLDAARARKHMFAEKPLGMGAKDSREMAEAVEKAGVIFSTGYFMRGNAAHLFLKDQIAKGAFGKITRVQASNCHSGSLGGWFDTEWRWMADPKIAGCGAFGDLGTHMLDIIMWLMGDVESVSADIKVVTGRYGDCDESGDALIRFKNGVSGTLAAGWVDVANPVSLLISGTEGNAVIFNGQLYFKSSKVEGADGKTPWTQLPAGRPHAFEIFLNAVGGQQDAPVVPVREAAARVSVMEAMYRAAAERKWVQPA